MKRNLKIINQFNSIINANTMAPKLYMVPASPPVRAVQMTAKALGIKLDLQELNFMAAEHMTPEYLKMNPQHTVPTLVDDDGFTIWDSHAIIIYLIAKYAKSDALYPKDLKTQAIINQRLHFDTGVAFASLIRIAKPIIRFGKKTIDEADKEAVVEAYQFLEAFLKGKPWVAGDKVSIADYCLVATVTSLDKLVPIDAKYPSVLDWLKRAESLPGYEENKAGLELFSKITKLS